MHGLKTFSCNHGERNTFEIGHIVMEEGEDIFSYLSEEFLSDERIRIDIIDNRQEIKFAGSKGEKEGAMLFLTREIQSGRKKNNKELVLKKIGEPFPVEWVRRLKSYDSNPDSTYWTEKVLIKKKWLMEVDYLWKYLLKKRMFRNTWIEVSDIGQRILVLSFVFH